MTKKNMHILFFWFMFILILVMSFYSLFTSKKEIALSTNSLDVGSIYLCETSYDAAGSTKIKICGSIITKEDSVPLRIFIYKMPEKKLVAENFFEDMFVNGEFSREFVLTDGDSGKYKVVIYLYREIVDETEFSIQK